MRESHGNNLKKRAIILCHGTMESLPLSINEEDYIICADGGAEYAMHFGLKPAVVLGDMDSISDSVLSHWKEQDIELEMFPVRKDQTDSELAVDVAIESGAREVVLLGAIGGRWDHSLANVFLLEKLTAAGRRGVVIADECQIWLLADKMDSLEVDGQPGETVSLIPISDVVTGVTLRGFDYPLHNESLLIGRTRGVSNKLLTTKGRVTIGSGKLLVLHTKRAE